MLCAMNASAGLEDYARRFLRPSAAEQYAARFETGARRRIHEREAAVVRKILKSLGKCETVLDLPCGAGRFLESLSAPDRLVVEADVSDSMLALARKRGAVLGAAATFVQADAARLDFAANAFDAVFCNRLLHHLESASERLCILREFQRVTARHLIISFFDYRRFGFLRTLLKRLKKRRPDYQRQPSLREFSQELESAGFAVERVVRVGWVGSSQKFIIARKHARSTTEKPVESVPGIRVLSTIPATAAGL